MKIRVYKKLIAGVLSLLMLCSMGLDPVPVQAQPVGTFVIANGGATALYLENASQTIFANGNAITIEARGEGAVVYYTSDTAKVPILFEAFDGVNSEDEPMHKGDGIYRLNQCSIYGGSDSTDITGSTSVTMTGGEVSTISGGCRNGAVTDNTSVSVTGGKVMGGIYGGSSGNFPDKCKVGGKHHYHHWRHR